MEQTKYTESKLNSIIFFKDNKMHLKNLFKEKTSAVLEENRIRD